MSLISSKDGGRRVGGEQDLTYDAWGRSKVVIDNSVIHGMFTFVVPVTAWKESLNGVELSAFSNAISQDGKLVLSSNSTPNDKVKLDTFRNPRYEPNRGHLYSISAFLPSPNADGVRSFGVFTDDSGAFFRLKSDGLYACRRTTVGGVTSDIEELITSELAGLEKGNTFDIQFQWRGVGDYYFYVNQNLVHTMYLLGSLEQLSMFNPAAPIAFECINQGGIVKIECGCVDVSSEGGEDNGKSYTSLSVCNNTGQIAVTGYNTPVLVAYNESGYGGLANTRDVLALLGTAYADQRCVFRVWATRDQSAITLNDQVLSAHSDGLLSHAFYDLNDDGSALVGTPMTFDTSKATLVFGARIDQDTTYTTTALFEGRTSIYQTPGDYFIFTVHRENGNAANVGVTYEFAESI